MNAIRLEHATKREIKLHPAKLVINQETVENFCEKRSGIAKLPQRESVEIPTTFQISSLLYAVPI